jgi:outer membrane cobalamin receptor
MTASTNGRPESLSPSLLSKLALCAALAAAMPARATTDLTRVDLEQLLQLTVVSAAKYEQKQGEVAAAASIITRQEIQAFGWRTLGQALATLPGIHLTDDRQYTYLGTRGFGLPGDFNTRVLLTIDGNRVNDPLYDGAASAREFPLDMDLVERIEFIPGPGSAVYGQNAMFGVVNVITRNGAGLGGTELTAAYQSPQSLREGRASWGKTLDNGMDVLVSVSGLYARGDDLFFDYGRSGVSGLAVGLDGERNQQFFARAGRGAWALELVYGDRRKDDPTGGYFSDPLVSGQYQADGYTLAQLQYQESYAGDTLHVSGRLFAGQQRYRSDLSYGRLFAYSSTSDWHGAELRLLSTALAEHKLMLGLELQDNARVDQTVQDPTLPAGEVHIASPGYRAGVFAQDEWRLAESLTATLGLRLDHDDAAGNAWSPRAALIWQATPETSFKALYGRAQRAPNAYESEYDDGVSVVANRALKGERIDTVEVVADHRMGRDLALRASVYQWTLRDLITLGIDPVSGLPQYRSSGNTVDARGLEVSADKTWQGGARLRGNASLQDVAPAGEGRLTNSPRLLAKLNLSSPLPVAGLSVAYELQYDGSRRTVAGAELGGYAVSHLRLNAEARAAGVGLSLDIQNLFDKHYAHPAADTNWQDALVQDGRSVRVTLRYRY